MSAAKLTEAALREVVALGERAAQPDPDAYPEPDSFRAFWRGRADYGKAAWRHAAAMAAELLEARAEIERLRRAGEPMANVCFNWAQSSRFTEHERSSLKGMQREWDAAKGRTT